MSGRGAVEAFRRRLSHDELFGVRSVHGDVSSIVALADAGLDYVYLDQQHGTVTASQIATIVDAVAALPLVVLVRVAESSAAAIGTALDAGADGVIAPDVADAEDAVRVLSNRAVR